MHRWCGELAGGRDWLSDDSSGAEFVLGRAIDHLPGRKLGEQVHAAGLGDLYVGIFPALAVGRCRVAISATSSALMSMSGWMSRPKHGLTAAQREAVELPSMVRADQRGVDLTRWSPDVVTCCIWRRACPTSIAS